MTARIIFSLSALAANLLAGSGAGVSHPAPADSLPRLLRSVVPYVISAADHSSAAPSFDDRAPHATLALDALTGTRFRSSLWLVASLIAVNLLFRRHQRVLLRC